MAMVVGYGSDIRGDRAAGRAVAEAIAAWEMPGVSTHSIDHLTREHAKAMANVGIAIFVGTYDAGADDPVRVTRIETARSPGNVHYINSPESLLALFDARHGRRPEGWSVLIPAEQTDVNAELSASAEEKVIEATDRVLDLLQAPRDSGRRTVKQRVHALLRRG
jgi:Ni,Fe-hydrogenase maturation factor